MSNVLPAALIAALLPNSPLAAVPSHPICTADHTAAHIVRAAAADYPALAKLEGLSGTATIRVDLSETGTVQGAFV